MSRSDSLWSGFLTSTFGACTGVVIALVLDASGQYLPVAVSAGAFIASVSAAAVYLLQVRREQLPMPHAIGKH